MSRAFQSWSPRTKPLAYDSLQQDVGCQDMDGFGFYTIKPFTRICVSDYSNESDAIYSQPDKVSYATGPLHTGGELPWVTRWAAWASPSGVRVVKRPLVELPASTLGSPSGLYPSTVPSKVSIGFTDGGQIALAIQKSEHTTEVKWYRDGGGVNIGTASFLGVSAVLFQNAILPSGDDPQESDLAVYYLRREVDRTLFVRFLREDFGVEYIASDSLQVNLETLIAVEADGAKQVLYALDNFSRKITLRTDDYILAIDGDKTTLSASVARGSYHESAVKTTLPLELMTLSASVVRGSYDDPIQEPPSSLSGDKTTLSIGIQSGDYSE